MVRRLIRAVAAVAAFQRPVAAFQRPPTTSAAAVRRSSTSSAGEGDVHIHTPLVWSSALSARVGADVYLKMDALQPGGSFKARGIGRLCAKLADAGATTLVSSSCANAGMAAAVAGRALGVSVAVVASDVDRDCRLLDAFRRLGAEVVFHGATWNDADAEARRRGDADGAAYVEMFDDPAIMSGHATLVEEIVADRNGTPPDAVVVSVGGGGLLSGVCEGLTAAGWDGVPVYACQSERCALLEAALAAGRPVSTPVVSADGHDLGARTVAAAALAWSRAMDVKSTLVPDAAALGAVARFLDDERVMVEPGAEINH